MKVRDLIALLSEYDLDSEVILQSDSEGNGYSPCAGADPDSVYISDSSYSGTVFSLNWTQDESGLDDSEWAEMKNKPKCVVLYPVN